MKYKKWKWILGAIVLLIIGLYIAGANFMVNAALVPSTMEKLEAFSSITQESIEALVQTDDIKQEAARSRDLTIEWVKNAKGTLAERTTEDGYRLIAQEIYAPEEDSHNWVILLHGYTGWKEAMYPFGVWYSRLGFHVLAPDMRCHGESEGDFIGMGYQDRIDNRMWIDYILEKDPEAQIVIHGQSMGAASALMMSGEASLPANVKAIVSDCAFSDAYTMFEQKMKEWFHLPSFPLLNTANFFLQIRGGYDLREASPLEYVKKSHTPTLFIHGDRDEMISAEMSKEMYEAASCPKSLLIVEDAGHAQASAKDPKGYYKAIEQLLHESGVL